MKPRFTDAERFPPGGYVKSAKTDIAATFRRIRRELAEQAKVEQDAMQNVKQINRRKQA